MSAPAEPRFGIWAPVYGTWGARSHPVDPVDASYRRTRDLLVAAEAHGFESTLLAEHIVSPSDAQAAVLETFTAAAAIAEATEHLEIIAAVKPLLFHPGVLAKLALGIDDISGGRFAINLVSAWFKPEMAALGIEMPPHDERYALSAEWLDVVQRLWAGEPLDHRGARFATEALQLVPGPVAAPPTVYFGGESEPARALAARAADVFFINGRALPEVVEVIDDLRSRPRTGRAPLRFGLSAFVIAREDERDAHAEHDALVALAAGDDRRRLMAGTDKDVAMMKVNAGVPRVGTNGGTLAGLVGSYDQVAERIAAFAAAGIELFMLQFQPLEAEAERFGREVIPRVRALTLAAA
ncbi:MAG TPA: LLM class flavin-dependent oxidoreductase [Baekduia sp.]|jgi:alkanesulfonate monooxygenase